MACRVSADCVTRGPAQTATVMDAHSRRQPDLDVSLTPLPESGRSLRSPLCGRVEAAAGASGQRSLIEVYTWFTFGVQSNQKFTCGVQGPQQGYKNFLHLVYMSV